MSEEFINPYATPVPVRPESPVVPTAHLDGDQGLSCILIHKNIQHRILAVRGSINAVIEWNALGFSDYIAVDGEKIESRFNFLFLPVREFEIQTEAGSHRITLELRSIWRSILRGVRLRVDDRLVYSEGKWPTD